MLVRIVRFFTRNFLCGTLILSKISKKRCQYFFPFHLILEKNEKKVFVIFLFWKALKERFIIQKLKPIPDTILVNSSLASHGKKFKVIRRCAVARQVKHLDLQYVLRVQQQCIFNICRSILFELEGHFVIELYTCISFCKESCSHYSIFSKNILFKHRLIYPFTATCRWLLWSSSVSKRSSRAFFTQN